MNKLWLIFKREYLTRVTRRSFILATILTPLAIALFLVITIFIFSYEGGEKKRIAVLDNGEILAGTTLSAKADGTVFFKKETQKSLEELKREVENGSYDGVLVLPALKNVKAKDFTVYYYSDDRLNLDDSKAIEYRVARVIREYKMESFGLDEKVLESLETSVSLDPQPLQASDEDVGALASVIAAGIGGAMGFIMYFTVFIYGMMVMRSVMEEKTSRIVEVMISSVKPFQLMLGKILGVGAVGLTQVAIWAILLPAIYFLVALFFGFDSDAMQATPSTSSSDFDPDEIMYMMSMVQAEIGNINWWLIVPLFIFFFLGGYFLYASLFAAVGSAMGDDMGESQSLTIPITIPVILAFYIMFRTISVPDSNLAVWSSLFPLFSPIVMPARLAFDPPWWQIVLSVVFLIIGALFFVWISARIYRVGILMYGKKVTLRELGKWMFRR